MNRIGAGLRALSPGAPGELAGVALVFGVAGLGALALQAVSIRVMNDVSVASLILTYGWTSVVSTLTSLGLPQLILRLGSSGRPSIGSEIKVFGATTVVATLVGLGTVLLAHNVTQLGAQNFGTLALLLPLIVVANFQMLLASYLRLAGLIKTGAFVLQGTLGVAAVLLLAVSRARAGSVDYAVGVGSLLGAEVILVVTGLVALRGRWPAFQMSEQALPRHLILQLGVTLWISSALAIGFRWLDRFVLSFSLPLAELATYQSLFVITGVIDALSLAVGYLAIPRYAKRGTWRAGQLANSFVLASVAGIVTLAAGYLLGPWLFQIRWQEGSVFSLFALTVAGGAKLIYTEASAALGGAGRPGAVGRFIGYNFFTMVVGATLTLWWGALWGMGGVALGAATTWTLRAIIAVLTARKNLPIEKGGDLDERTRS